MSYPPPNDPQPQPYWQQPTGPAESYPPPTAPHPGQQPLPPPAAMPYVSQPAPAAYPGPQQPYPSAGAPYMGQQQFPAYGQPPGRVKRKKMPFILGGVGVVLALCLGGTILNASADDSSSDSGGHAAAASTPAAAAAKTAAARPAKTKTATTAPKPTVSTSSYSRLTDRKWLLIVKDPDGHAGDKVVIYGIISQFDAATGSGIFRANAGPTKNQDASDTNTIFVGDAGVLADMVQGDEFRAEAIVVGAESYDTQEGGSTVAPKLQVESIRKL